MFFFPFLLSSFLRKTKKEKKWAGGQCGLDSSSSLCASFVDVLFELKKHKKRFSFRLCSLLVVDVREGKFEPEKKMLEERAELTWLCSYRCFLRIFRSIFRRKTLFFPALDEKRVESIQNCGWFFFPFQPHLRFLFHFATFALKVFFLSYREREEKIEENSTLRDFISLRDWSDSWVMIEMREKGFWWWKMWSKGGGGVEGANCDHVNVMEAIKSASSKFFQQLSVSASLTE